MLSLTVELQSTKRKTHFESVTICCICPLTHYSMRTKPIYNNCLCVFSAVLFSWPHLWWPFSDWAPLSRTDAVGRRLPIQRYGVKLGLTCYRPPTKLTLFSSVCQSFCSGWGGLRWSLPIGDPPATCSKLFNLYLTVQGFAHGPTWASLYRDPLKVG